MKPRRTFKMEMIPQELPDIDNIREETQKFSKVSTKKNVDR